VAASSIIVGDFWRGRHLIVSNAGWIGNSNVAPRAHPNDGKVEVLTITSQMSLRQRFLARRKMQTGTHLPHPDLSSKQIATQSIVRQNGEKLMIDGRKIDNWASISIRVEPDYWRVLV
jgi:diacylglycerol kinase family enzyme